MFSRYDIADAAVLLGRHGIGKQPSREIRALSDLSSYGYHVTLSNRLSDIASLEDSALVCYFAMLAKRAGVDAAITLADQWDRATRKSGVTIQVEQSDDDPYQISFTVRGDVADAWCDNHGALDGGTWEHAGDDLYYDHGQWAPTLLSDLRAEGFDIDTGHMGVCNPLDCFDDAEAVDKWAERQGFEDDAIADGIKADLAVWQANDYEVYVKAWRDPAYHFAAYRSRLRDDAPDYDAWRQEQVDMARAERADEARLQAEADALQLPLFA